MIGGRPSMGKTALGLHMALAVAQGGAGVLFVSLEMSQRELGIRAVCALASEPRDVIPYSDAARGRIDPEQTARLRGAAQQLRGLPLCIDDRAGLNLAGLRATARQQARRWRRDGVPFRLIVVDHMGLVGERAGRNENETLRLGRISAGLKALAKDLGIAVLALHQLNRGVEARDNKRPTLADLRDSGAIEQDADAVAFVYRGEYYVRRNRPTDPDAEADWHAELAKVANKVEVILAKQRQGETGTVAAYCDIAGNLFRDGRQH